MPSANAPWCLPYAAHPQVGLRAKQQELAELRSKLAAMESDLRTNTKKKERLEQEVALCRWGSRPAYLLRRWKATSWYSIWPTPTRLLG